MEDMKDDNAQHPVLWTLDYLQLKGVKVPRVVKDNIIVAWSNHVNYLEEQKKLSENSDRDDEASLFDGKAYTTGYHGNDDDGDE